MVAWNPPSDALLATGKPGRPSHARAIRDLTAALSERASGSPWLNGIGAMEIFQRGFGVIHGAPPEIAGERRLVGSWTVPNDVYRIHLTIIGGGGRGGEGQAPTADGGGGGAGAVNIIVLDVTPGEVHTMILGAGGFPTSIHPDVNTSLDSYAIGDGARTTFGTRTAAGGKRGQDGPGGGDGGAGGNLVDGQVPTSPGGAGGPGLLIDTFSLDESRSGRGGSSYLGGGAPGRFDVGAGHDAGAVILGESWVGVPGTGGGGGRGNENGGRGCHGAIILRY